jgi:hypothetical protein
MQHEERFNDLVKLYNYLMRIWKWYDEKEMKKTEAINSLEYLIGV